LVFRKKSKHFSAKGIRGLSDPFGETLMIKRPKIERSMCKEENVKDFSGKVAGDS
jgi:hypothetical protein